MAAATHEDVRDLADAVRDLATAQDRSRLDRIEMRAEGAERGKLVVEAVKEVLSSQAAIIESNTKATDELRRAKTGMPWPIAAALITFNALLTIFVVSIYAQSNGEDAGAAAKVATEIVPTMPSAGMDSP